MPSPTEPPSEPPSESSKKPKYAALVELLNTLKEKEAQKNKKPENRTQMREKNGESFKFTE